MTRENEENPLTRVSDPVVAVVVVVTAMVMVVVVVVAVALALVTVVVDRQRGGGFGAEKLLQPFVCRVDQMSAWVVRLVLPWQDLREQ